MKRTDRRLTAWMDGFTPETHEEKVMETVNAAKAAFLVHESETPLGSLAFLYLQSRYIRKRWWIAQACLLAVLWFMLRTCGTGLMIRRSMGIAAPVFAMLLIPEIWKNKSSRSLEIECASYYSVRQVYAARFVLFALADTLLLTLFFAASATAGIAATELVTDFLIPMTVTCCICFRTLASRHISSEFLCTLLCFVWTALWTALVLREGIYARITGPVWAGIAAMALVYLAYSVRQALNRTAHICEVQTLWN